MTEREAAMALALASGVGPVTAARLLESLGSYREAVRALSGGGTVAGVRPEVARAVGDSVARRSWLAESKLARRAGARFALPGDADYPDALSQTVGAPVGLFVSGETLGPLTPMVAVVGSRTPTPRGAAVAAELAADLARAGLTITSGLARGTDTRAHEGALDAGGMTVAVLGCGLSRVYPPENAGLARDIVGSGSLVSEFPMAAKPKPGYFPRRNRVISGLSVGVVVVEAASRSGALITAARALEQGREVFAVPGPVDEPLSAGPNRLIKAGAKLTEDAGDVLDELERSWGPFPITRPDLPAAYGAGDPPDSAEGNRATAGPLSSRLMELLSLRPVSVDDLVAGTGAPVDAVLSTLLKLELADEVRTSAGGRFVLGERARRRAGRA